MNEHQPVAARPSATIVVVRQGESAAEVLLVRRRAGDAFGDSYAFPGGVVDHDEATAHDYCDGRSAEDADAILETTDGLDYYSAAIRELFEETGILLARDTAGQWLGECGALEEPRIRVDKGELPWRDFLDQQGLRMAADSLHYFAHWETPLMRPKRWTTRFFLAELPTGQIACHDGSEVTDSRWIVPADALAEGEKGVLPMPFPTTRILGDLSQFDSVDEVIAWAKNQPAAGIVKIRPIILMENGKPKIVAPGDPGFDQAHQS